MLLKNIIQVELLNLYADLERCEETIILALNELENEKRLGSKRGLESKIRKERKYRASVQERILKLQSYRLL